MTLNENGLNPKYTLDNFVDTEKFPMMLEAAKTVVNEPHSSLFIYGESGVGKTHLLHAIGNEMLEKNAELNVKYVSAVEFANDYIQRAKQSQISRFNFREYYDFDVLLFDDVQFLINKLEILRDFQSIFLNLRQKGKTVVISSDREPINFRESNKGLDFGKLSELFYAPRFTGAIEYAKKDNYLFMTKEISKPDYDGRLRILRKKADEMVFDLSEEAGKYLAVHVDTNVRDLENALATLKGYADSHQIDVIDTDFVEKVLGTAVNGSSENEIEIPKLSEILDKYYDKLEHLSQDVSVPLGYSTGFPAVDELTNGVHDGELIVLAGRRGMGKMSFGLQIAKAIVRGYDKTALIYSLAVGAENLVNSMISEEALIDVDRLRTVNLSDDDWNNMTIAMGRLADVNIHIDDSLGITISDIRSKARKIAKNRKNLGLILIDYLELILDNGGGNRELEILHIMRELKSLAKELSVPIIVNSQFSRSVEQREDKRPRLIDLKHSGAIWHNADVVAFLHRDAYYLSNNGSYYSNFPDTHDNGYEIDNKAEVMLYKTTFGKLGTAEMLWVGQFGKFVNIDYGRDRMSSMLGNSHVRVPKISSNRSIYARKK